MPLVPSVLSEQIAALMVTEINAVLPGATPTPFQRDLASAVSAGIIKSLKTEAKAVGTTGFSAIGTGVGINGLSPDRMVAFAVQVFRSKIGSTGIATEAILSAVFKPTVLHLQTATVISITGFGGPLLSVLGLVESAVTQNILDAFPSGARATLDRSRFGKILLESIASGFVREVLTSGIPGAIPMAGIVPGPTIGMFT